MKGIVFTKEQIEARKNGATMFMVPIGVKADKIEEAIKSFGKENLINSALREAPLQKGDEFFIQEDFTEDEILLGGNEILYKNDFMPRDFKNSAIGYGLTTDYMKERVLKRCNWNDATQMQEHQSRHKDICLDIEVKRAGDIFMNEVECCKMMGNVIDDTFPYKNDDYVFLITYKGIQK